MDNSNIFEEDFKFEEKDDKIEKSPQIDIFEEVKDLSKIKEIQKDRKIEMIQLFLILFLIVGGSLIYFFGYDLFKPFIKID